MGGGGGVWVGVPVSSCLNHGKVGNTWKRSFKGHKKVK